MAINKKFMTSNKSDMILKNERMNERDNEINV